MRNLVVTASLALGFSFGSQLSYARSFPVVLDAPSELLRRYTAEVSVVIEYANQEQTGRLTFNRDDLVQGFFRKQVTVQDDIEISACRSLWLVMSPPPGGTPPDLSEVPLLMPAVEGYISGVCQIKTDGTEVSLRMSLKYTPLALILSKESLAHRSARAVVGKLVGPNPNKNYSFVGQEQNAPKTWLVNVLALEGFEFVGTLTWLKHDGTRETSEFRPSNGMTILQ